MMRLPVTGRDLRERRVIVSVPMRFCTHTSLAVVVARFKRATQYSAA